MIPPGKLAIDASVAVKWYIPEPGSSEAASILQRESSLVAPDLLAAEFGNVLWKKVRRGELRGHEAKEITDAFTSTSPVVLLPVAPFLASAVELAIRWGCTVYDGLYLAVALAEGCPLVTADERLSQQFRATALEQSVLVLARPQ